ncbi:MAG: PhzF family phenazine biosynthesis protein [Chloroflexi bacterium]|nr:PhzF family phenazine biosynthesis protein [Chloroflexota bacterium]
MPRRFRFRQVDVFTERPLAGNPLAVFPEAEGLDDGEMQAIAREMNLSETTFVLPPTHAGRAQGADYRMRIFTPRTELPFAGHPSIGTAWVLASEGRFPVKSPRTQVRQEISIGVLPLTIAVLGDPSAGWPGGQEVDIQRGTTAPMLGEVTMTQAQTEISDEIPEDQLDELCAALEVPARYLGWQEVDGRYHPVSEARPTVVSTGLPFLVVPFRDRGLLSDVDAERTADVGRLAAEYGCDSAALVAAGSSGEIADADVHARVFVHPRSGITEDPATGSAAGPIAVYLGRLLGIRGRTYRVIIEQGIEVGRPSRLVAEVDFDEAGVPDNVRVSGATVPVIEGWIELP